MTVDSKKPVVVGVLALQGAFHEHIQLLERAYPTLLPHKYDISFKLVKAELDLLACSALIIPGGESTTMALIAERTNLLEPLRNFVKVSRYPTWGTCAGMILLSEAANRTKRGGQELIGGLDVRVNRNHFGRQVESFITPLKMECLGKGEAPFNGVFIRAPVVEAVLPKTTHGNAEKMVHAPSRKVGGEVERRLMEGAWESVEVLARLPAEEEEEERGREKKKGGNAQVVAVRQGNVFGTSFHPELTGDVRLHRWWLERVVEDLRRREEVARRVQVEVR